MVQPSSRKYLVLWWLVIRPLTSTSVSHVSEKSRGSRVHMNTSRGSIHCSSTFDAPTTLPVVFTWWSSKRKFFRPPLILSKIGYPAKRSNKLVPISMNVGPFLRVDMIWKWLIKPGNFYFILLFHRVTFFFITSLSRSCCFISRNPFSLCCVTLARKAYDSVPVCAIEVLRSCESLFCVVIDELSKTGEVLSESYG